LDPDPLRVHELQQGRLPVSEPGLADLTRSGIESGFLRFAGDAAAAVSKADVVWATFDTPVGDDDRADVNWVRAQLEAVRRFVDSNTLVLVSSQVPVGFTRSVEHAWRTTDPTLEFAYSPENLRLGTAIKSFTEPKRIVVGMGEDTNPDRVRELFGPLASHIEWMSIESAEMTKHALNGFLALSVAYTNEVARICERVGADAGEVERGLRSEPRIGRHAYITAGGPIAGGTLARDVAFLTLLAGDHGLESPVLRGIQESNRLHELWLRERVSESLTGVREPRVAVLGLTYKPGTDTLRRSSSIELAHWLVEVGAHVRAYDPAVLTPRPETSGLVLAAGSAEALEHADVAVVATPWPEFTSIDANLLVRTMRRARIIDQTGFLSHLGMDSRVEYVRVGRPAQNQPA
jgi:UDPglucose 6-dehydrogenase